MQGAAAGARGAPHAAAHRVPMRCVLAGEQSPAVRHRDDVRALRRALRAPRPSSSPRSGVAVSAAQLARDLFSEQRRPHRAALELALLSAFNHAMHFGDVRAADALWSRLELLALTKGAA